MAQPLNPIMYGVFPTPVGMNRLPPLKPRWGCSVPHARGDEPVRNQLADGLHRVFPTPVGMNRRKNC